MVSKYATNNIRIEENTKPAASQNSGFKIYTDSPSNLMTLATLISADLTNTNVESVVANEQITKELAQKKALSQNFPVFET